MNFEDADDGGARWGRGSVGLLAAGGVHLGTLALQLVSAVALTGWFALQPASDLAGLAAFLFLAVGAPAVLSLAVGVGLLLAGRRQRDAGPGAGVIVAVVAGIFWPAFQLLMGLVFCTFPFMPLYLFNALATLVAAGLIVTDRPTPPATPGRATLE